MLLFAGLFPYANYVTVRMFPYDVNGKGVVIPALSTVKLSSGGTVKISISHLEVASALWKTALKYLIGKTTYAVIWRIFMNLKWLALARRRNPGSPDCTSRLHIFAYTSTTWRHTWTNYLAVWLLPCNASGTVATISIFLSKNLSYSSISEIPMFHMDKCFSYPMQLRSAHSRSETICCRLWRAIVGLYSLDPGTRSALFSFLFFCSFFIIYCRLFIVYCFFVPVRKKKFSATARAVSSSARQQYPPRSLALLHPAFLNILWHICR